MKTAIPIRTGWQLCGFDRAAFCLQTLLAHQTAEAKWLDVYACEDVHSALMRHGVIDDPAVGANDEAAEWVAERIWVYRVRFTIPSGRPYLIFQGLDTFADVYLNGKLTARCENMLVAHTVDIGEQAVLGDNELVICFYPVHECCAEKTLPEGFWINYATDRAYARKAAYAFGWDWTPRVLTVGIWREVVLIMEEDGLLGGLTGATLSIEEQSATIRLSARLMSEPKEEAQFCFTLTDPDGHVAARICSAEPSVRLRVNDPQLWWTHDLGKPALYTVRCSLLAGGREQDVIERSMGIRTVAMRIRREDGRPCFVLMLNGNPLCARGANWVPMSNRPSSVSADRYVHLLRLAKEAGMNLLSLWGGGIYEQDAFYDTCDREGLLVWQYFMFACGEYPGEDEAFVCLVRREVDSVVQRLALHPCIAMWIGNVESEMLCQKIGQTRPMHGAVLFEREIPGWLRVWDPERFYLPSSPWGERVMNGQEDYDRHNWDVWFTDIPYTEYEKDMTTFASEFGMHAAPIRATVEKGCGKGVMLGDFAFSYFNRDQDPGRMAYYLRTNTGEPRDLDAYIDQTMLVQAEGVAFACEHYRRRFPDCGGALVWQLNDCCPVQSWSLIDVDLNPKAAYYAVRRSFAPLTISLKAMDANSTEVWALNDTQGARQVDVEVEVGSLLGRRVYREMMRASLAPGERKCMGRVTVGGRFYPNVMIGNRIRMYYLAASMRADMRPQVRFFAKYKDMALPKATLTVKAGADGVRIASDVLAYMVKIDGEMEGLHLSDNYGCILPGTQWDVRIKRIWGKPIEQRKLLVRAMNAEPMDLVFEDKGEQADGI